MRRIVSVALPLAFLFLSAIPTPTLAQEAPPPELQRFNYFMGEWTYDVGSSSGTMAWEWFGDFLARANEENTTASGNTTGLLHVFGYDTEEEVFTWHRYWSSGNIQIARGWVHGDTWTFLFDDPVGMKTRLIMVETSTDVVTFHWERSIEGGPWEVTSEGRMTKVR